MRTLKKEVVIPKDISTVITVVKVIIFVSTMSHPFNANVLNVIAHFMFSVPEFEYQPVQTGFKQIEKWITDDGRKFDSEHEAEKHEFLTRVKWKHRNPNLHFDPETLEFSSLEDARRYQSIYSWDSPLLTTLESLQYPSKFISFQEYIGCECEPQNEEDSDYCYCSHEEIYATKLVSIEEYKRMLIEHIDTI